MLQPMCPLAPVTSALAMSARVHARDGEPDIERLATAEGLSDRDVARDPAHDVDEVVPDEAAEAVAVGHDGRPALEGARRELTVVDGDLARALRGVGDEVPGPDPDPGVHVVEPEDDAVLGARAALVDG